MITLKFLAGYWTVLVDGQPLMQFPTYAAAIEAVPEAVHLRAVA